MVRDYVYVGDVIDAYIGAASSPHGSTIYNVARRSEIPRGARCDRNKVFFDRFGAGVGWVPKRLWDTRVWVGDPALIKSELGWAATTSLTDGLTRTAAWLAAHPLEALAAAR